MLMATSSPQRDVHLSDVLYGIGVSETQAHPLYHDSRVLAQREHTEATSEGTTQLTATVCSTDSLSSTGKAHADASLSANTHLDSTSH